MTQAISQPHFLMCRPEHFAVRYAINPWMKPQVWARSHQTLAPKAQREWLMLYYVLRNLGAAIDLIAPAPGLPDLVFTANAAVVLDRKVLLARFLHPERKGEEPHFEKAFHALRAHGVVDVIHKMPNDIALEGAGDCVFDAVRNLFWLGYGQRSDKAARDIVAEVFHVETLALELADPRFYHMDTAFCPLANGEVMYVPGAFTSDGLALIRERIPKTQLIEIAEDDAARLAANAVCLGDAVVLSAASERLRNELSERGYRVILSPLDAFLRSGGSAFCLTLRLDLISSGAEGKKKQEVA